MVEISDIHDRMSLEAWLQETDQTMEACCWIAYRASIRALPKFWSWAAKVTSSGGLRTPATPVLRAILITGIAARGVTQHVGAASTSAATAASKSNLEAEAGGPYASACAASSAMYAAKGVKSFGLNTVGVTVGASNAAAAFFEESSIEAEFWKSVRDDCKANQTSKSDAQNVNRPLWADAYVATEVRQGLENDLDTTATDWSFWLDWYDRALAGTEDRWDLLQRIALSDLPRGGTERQPEDYNAFWEGTDAEVNARINAIWHEWSNEGFTPLAQAAFVEFDFDAARKWLRAVAFSDDLAHLKDESRVEPFLDDCQELRDSIGDFLDYASDVPASNAGPLHVARAAEKLLAEFQFAADNTHLRARRMIDLATQFRMFSLDESQRDALGEGLSSIADDLVDRLQSMFATHFGRSLEKLQALNDLDLGNIPPDELLTALRDALDVARRANGDSLARLSDEAIATLEFMVDELERDAAAIDDVASDDHRQVKKDLFARRTGGVAASFGRYLTKSKEYAKKSPEWVDSVLDQFKRAKGLNDLWDFLIKFFDGGGPPSGAG